MGGRRRDVAWRLKRYGTRGVAWRQLSVTTRAPHGRCGEGGRGWGASSPRPPRPCAVAAAHPDWRRLRQGGSGSGSGGRGRWQPPSPLSPPRRVPRVRLVSGPRTRERRGGRRGETSRRWDLDTELGAGQRRAPPRRDGAPPPRPVPTSPAATPRRQCAAVASRSKCAAVASRGKCAALRRCRGNAVATAAPALAVDATAAATATVTPRHRRRNHRRAAVSAVADTRVTPPQNCAARPSAAPPRGPLPAGTKWSDAERGGERQLLATRPPLGA